MHRDVVGEWAAANGSLWGDGFCMSRRGTAMPGQGRAGRERGYLFIEGIATSSRVGGKTADSARRKALSRSALIARSLPVHCSGPKMNSG